MQGLASYGLTRVELLGAGLSNEAIDRLYRCMYVYTVGFFDVMQVQQYGSTALRLYSSVGGWKGVRAARRAVQKHRRAVRRIITRGCAAEGPVSYGRVAREGNDVTVMAGGTRTVRTPVCCYSPLGA